MRSGQLSKKRLTDEADFDDSQDCQNGTHPKRTKTSHSNKSTFLPTSSSTGPSLIRHSSSAMSIDDFDMMSDPSAVAYSQPQSLTFSPISPPVSIFVMPQNNNILNFNIGADDDGALDLDDVVVDDDEQPPNEDLLHSTTPTSTHDRANTPGSIMNEMGKLELEVGSGETGSQRNTTADRERVVHNMLQPVGLGQDNQSRAGKLAKRFTMGYRADCEKCRLKVPGHWAHPPGIS